MNFSLQEEAENQYIAFYRSFLEDVQKINEKVNTEWLDVMRQSKYERLQKLIAKMVDSYTETIVKNIDDGVFVRWTESGGSLRAFLKAYQAGAEADAVACQIEQRMKDILSEVLKIENAPQILTDHTMVSESGMNQLENVCSWGRAEISLIKKAYLLRIASEKQQNEIYNTLQPLIIGISENLEAFLEVSQQGFIQLHEFVRQISTQLHNRAQENIGQTAQAAGNSTAPTSGDIAAQASGNPVAPAAGNATAPTSGDIAAQASGNPAASEPGNEQNVFTGTNLTENDVREFVTILERIVEHTGVDALNRTVDRNYQVLNGSRQIYVQNRQNVSLGGTPVVQNKYGRYTVTAGSIRQMHAIYGQMTILLQELDKYYKEKFDSLKNKLEKANTVIHTLASFMGLYSVGALNVGKLLTESDEDLFARINIGGIALSSCSNIGKVILGSTHVVKVLDWAMPYIKKSKKLVKLNERVWRLTRMDMQAPYINRMADWYIMEHYEVEYGLKGVESRMFAYAHEVDKTLTVKAHRIAFESGCFATELVIATQYEWAIQDVSEYRAKFLGICLNLIRSCMCHRQDISAENANQIVDRLYDIYVREENLRPRVELNPDNKKVR